MGSSLSYPTVDLTNKVAIVTGGNGGIGYETSKALAVMGAHTIIACRSEERAITAIEQMKQEVLQSDHNKTISVEYMQLDLSSFKSTKDFTIAYKEKSLPLDILINNAGILGPPLTMTEDDNESQFQVNHLSHFLLTLELLPVLLNTTNRTGDGRIVILTSSAHRAGVFDPTNLNAETSFGRLSFYSNSKLFNVMHGYALQRRLQNSTVTVSSLHPGVVNTDLFAKATDSGGKQVLIKTAQFFMKPIMKNVQQGAVTTINCAVNPELNKREHYYYANCRVESPILPAQDKELQEQLWEISIDKVKDWLSPESLELYGKRIETSRPLEEVPVEETEETPVNTEDVPVEETPVNTKDVPVNETEEIPVNTEDVPVEETPVNTEDVPVKETEETPVNTEDVPLEETEETPVNTEDVPVEETPVNTEN